MLTIRWRQAQWDRHLSVLLHSHTLCATTEDTISMMAACDWIAIIRVLRDVTLHVLASGDDNLHRKFFDLLRNVVRYYLMLSC
jgi:hypothetical protein